MYSLKLMFFLIFLMSVFMRVNALSYLCDHIQSSVWLKCYPQNKIHSLSPLDSKEIKPANPKGNQPWIFIRRTMLKLKLKLQNFGHLMQRAHSLEKTLVLGKIEDKSRRGWQRMRWLDKHCWFNGHEFQQTSGDSEGQGSLACCVHAVGNLVWQDLVTK